MAEKSAAAQHLALDEDLAPEPEVQIEAPDNSAEDNQERPDYLLDKFNSVEEQAKAYNEAQRRMHEETQARRSLEERLGQIEAQMGSRQEPQYEQPQYEDPYAYTGYDNRYDPLSRAAREQQLRELAEEDPLAAARAIAAETLDERLAQLQWQQEQQAQMERMRATQVPQSPVSDEATSQLIAREAMREVHGTYPDVYDHLEEIRPIVNEILPADKAYNVDHLAAAIERAYKLVKADELMNRDQDLREQGVPPEEIARQRKLEAQTMSGVSARPDDPSPEEKQMAEILAAGTGHSYDAWRARQGA